jgi:hypothetical protein
MAENSFIYYKFTGINSFLKTLEQSGTEYLLFDDNSEDMLKRERADIFTDKDDSIKTGLCKNGNEGVYFTEFAIQITKSYRSHIVFIFNHHPTVDELLEIAGQLDSLTESALEKADLSAITSAVQN